MLTSPWEKPPNLLIANHNIDNINNTKKGSKLNCMEIKVCELLFPYFV